MPTLYLDAVCLAPTSGNDKGWYCALDTSAILEPGRVPLSTVNQARLRIPTV